MRNGRELRETLADLKSQSDNEIAEGYAMSISFPKDSSQFGSEFTERLTMNISVEMDAALTLLEEALGKDRSKTVRWCIEQVLTEAIAQDFIKPLKR